MRFVCTVCCALVAAVVLCLLVPGGGAAAGGGRIFFPDLAGHWAAAEVARGVGLGFLDGYPDGTFRPDGAVTRAEFVKMVAAGFGLRPADEGAVFADCRGAWFEPYLAAACLAGVVVPDEHGGFYRPDEPIPRAEAAAYLVRALGRGWSAVLRGSGDCGFADAGEVPRVYRGHVAEAAALGLLRGYPDGTVRGGNGCTRAEAVVLVLRALDAREEAAAAPAARAVPAGGRRMYGVSGFLHVREVDEARDLMSACSGGFILSWEPGGRVMVEGVGFPEGGYAAGSVPDPDALFLFLSRPPLETGWLEGLAAVVAGPWPQVVDAGDPDEGDRLEVARRADGVEFVLSGRVRGPVPSVADGDCLLRRDLELVWEAAGPSGSSSGQVSATVWYDPGTLWCRRAGVLVRGSWAGPAGRVVASGQVEVVGK